MDFFVVDTLGGASVSTSECTPTIKLPKRKSIAFGSTTKRLADQNAATNASTSSTAEAAEEESDEDDFGGLPPPGQSIAEVLNDNDEPVAICRNSGRRPLVSASFVEDVRPTTSRMGSKNLRVTAANELNKTDVAKELRSSILTPAIEKRENLARFTMSDETLQHLNRLERHKTKGKSWFNLPAPEMTPELKNELELIQMRTILDPKKYYQRAEKKRKLPKYFQIGTVLESPLEHYNERGVKKQKSQTLVDELLADAEFQKFNKRKYAEALELRKKKAYHKAVMKMKKLKKKK
uniref:Fcf2 domain-containing protein n=1 Tax=Anopheles albimanus TaxID=7167 RepID=A0A182F405_ANOAL